MLPTRWLTPHDIGQGAPIEVRPANTIEGRPAGDARLRAQAERSIAINTAISTGALVNGMTEQEMFQVLGRPSTINTDVINGRANRQYVYRYSDGSTRYVYINETGVYALQERPSVASPATQPCYGELELRNAQMETTARFVSEEQRARRIERYRSMLACRR